MPDFEKPGIPFPAWANDPYYKAIATVYNPSTSYSAGDIVMAPDGSLVKALDSTTGDYDPTKWEETNIAENLGQGGSSLPDVSSSNNGDVLSVIDGAWAPEKRDNIFLIEVVIQQLGGTIYVTTDKTQDQIIEAFKGATSYPKKCSIFVKLIDWLYSSGNTLFVVYYKPLAGSSTTYSISGYTPPAENGDYYYVTISNSGNSVVKRNCYVIDLEKDTNVLKNTDVTLHELESSRNISTRFRTEDDGYFYEIIKFNRITPTSAYIDCIIKNLYTGDMWAMMNASYQSSLYFTPYTP